MKAPLGSAILCHLDCAQNDTVKVVWSDTVTLPSQSLRDSYPIRFANRGAFFSMYLFFYSVCDILKA